MKKRLTVAVLLCLALFLTSCDKKEYVSEETPSAGAPASPSVLPSASEAQPSAPQETAAEAFLKAEPSAAQVGRYLTENAAALTAGDGDLLLERLIILQQDIADMMNVRIWDNAYMTALNETMGGVFDPDRIDDIDDPDVRSVFSEVADALMTVVRYEETPVFEMDWQKLETFRGAFSAEAADMIGYHSRLQSGAYAGDPLDFDLLAADIAAVEERLAPLDSGFIRWQLRKVFYSQVSRFFTGPEGSFYGEYVGNGSEYTERLQEYAGMYSGRFGEMCREIYELAGEDAQAISDYLTGALIFPPDCPLSARNAVFEEDGAWLSLPVITGGDGALADALNAEIRDMALMMLESGRTDQSVSTYMTVSGAYMSVTFACSFLDGEGQYHYTETGLVLDLSTGGSVTLDDLVGAPFDSYKDALLNAMSGSNIPPELSLTPAFYLTGSGLTISVPSGAEGWPDYYAVTFNGLRSFMDISRLY